MPETPAKTYPGTPYGPPHEVNLRDMGTILQLLIKHDDLRASMLADPDAALKSLNYIPTEGAVAFFKTLNAANFDAAAKAFAPAHPDPQFGMAEI
jgi:hypothetical protein